MKILPIYLIASALAISPLTAAYTLKSGKLVNTEQVATKSVQEHYSLTMEAYEKEDWSELIRQATIVIKNFPGTPFVQESMFYLGAGYFHLEDYEMANKQLSHYLKKQTALQHFREAIELKFYIAEKFKEGARRHVLGWEALPKWMPAYEESLKIYEEVISALPNDDLAAKALFGKAELQIADEEYKTAIETYQTLIRRFPKNGLAPDAYVQIAKVYLTQCQEQYPDSDFLDLAEINFRKFLQDFPSDERLAVVESMYADMQEIYARSFYEIGQFFERTKKPHASVLYYSKIIKTYPNTKSAELSKERLRDLKPAEPVAPKVAQENETSLTPVPEHS